MMIFHYAESAVMSDPVHDAHRLELAVRVEAFLTGGGEITEVPVGKSAVSDPKQSHWKRSSAKQTQPKA